MHLKKNLNKYPLLKKIFKHSSVLFSGQLIFTLFGIVSLVITARVLGAEKLGILTLIQTSVFIISSVLLPKPWLTIVRYAAILEKENKFQALKKLVKYSFITEILFALFAGIIALIISPFIFEFISIHQEYATLFTIYAVSLFLNVTGTGIGLLRHYDEVKWIRNIEIGTGGLKLLLASVGWVLNLELKYFVVAFAATEVFRFLAINIIGYLISYKPKFQNIENKNDVSKIGELKEILSFSISMHFNDMLGTARREFDLVVIGALLSPQSVGFYKVIKQFSKMFTLLGNPLKQAVYPDICKLWANKEFKLFKKTQIQVISILLVLFISISTLFWFISEQVVILMFGNDFIPIINPLNLYIWISAVFIGFQILNSAVLAKGMGGKALIIESITNIVYFLTIFVLVPDYELFGVIYAYGLSVIGWIILFGSYSFKNK